MRFQLVLYRVLLLVLSLCGSAAATQSSAIDQQFEQLFRQRLDEQSVPGGAYAIVRDGRIVLLGGHGLRAAGSTQAVDADTVFRIASVSKTVAAQLTALVVMQGGLSWDDRLDRHLPEFALSKGSARSLRIRHLLGQSTGIVPNAYDNLLDANQPLQQILPQFAKLAPICAPGSCYTYQNILFGLIDPVLARVEKRPYAQLVDERLFRPLDMRTASIGLEAYQAASNRAAPHVRARGRWVPIAVQPGYYQVAPAAGVNASARDLGHWLLAQLGHRPDVLPVEAVRVLTEKGVRTRDQLRRRGWRELLTDAHYGLGWRVYQVGDEEIYLHSGWVKGFVADISYSRKHRAGLVLLLNAEVGLLGELASGFWSQQIQSAAAVSGAARAASP